MVTKSQVVQTFSELLFLWKALSVFPVDTNTDRHVICHKGENKKDLNNRQNCWWTDLSPGYIKVLMARN